MIVVAFGLSLFVVPMAISAYNQWTLYHSLANVRGMGWAIAIEVAVALAAYGIWRGQVRECDLLKHGEATMGRVLRQSTDNKNNSCIDYEWTDFLGTSHKGSVNDRTQKLFAGMPAVVFYDRGNPRREIAACATYHQVIVPSEPSFAPQELIGRR
jgi:hypothetical protein